MSKRKVTETSDCASPSKRKKSDNLPNAEHSALAAEPNAVSAETSKLERLEKEMYMWKQRYLDAAKAADAFSYRISCGPCWTPRQVLDYGDCDDTCEVCFADQFCLCEEKQITHEDRDSYYAIDRGNNIKKSDNTRDNTVSRNNA